MVREATSPPGRRIETSSQHKRVPPSQAQKPKPPATPPPKNVAGGTPKNTSRSS